MSQPVGARRDRQLSCGILASGACEKARRRTLLVPVLIACDKGRSHQESRSPFLKGSNSVPTGLISRRASEIMEVFEGGCDLKSSEIAIAAEVGDSVLYHSPSGLTSP